MGYKITTGGSSQKGLGASIPRLVDKLWFILLDAIFPRRCVGCKKVGYLLCLSCRGKLAYILDQRCVVCSQPSQGGFTHSGCKRRGDPERLFSAFRYRDPLRQAMFQWKYRDASVVYELLDSLLQEVCERFQVYIPKNFTLVPIPLHPQRMRERGFNQASLLAKSLATYFSLDCGEDLLIRVKSTPKQMEIQKSEEREKNVENAFALSPGKEREVEGQDFVLVDDVWTTGATCLEALRILKEAGAKTVWIFTLARGR